MTKKENQTKVKNFEIVDGKLFKNGHVIIPRADKKPVSKEDSLEEVKPTPAKEPKKRMRWYKGSFVKDEQSDTEKHESDNHIA